MSEVLSLEQETAQLGRLKRLYEEDLPNLNNKILNKEIKIDKLLNKYENRPAIEEKIELPKEKDNYIPRQSYEDEKSRVELEIPKKEETKKPAPAKKLRRKIKKVEEQVDSNAFQFLSFISDVYTTSLGVYHIQKANGQEVDPNDNSYLSTGLGNYLMNTKGLKGTTLNLGGIKFEIKDSEIMDMILKSIGSAGLNKEQITAFMGTFGGQISEYFLNNIDEFKKSSEYQTVKKEINELLNNDGVYSVLASLLADPQAEKELRDNPKKMTGGKSGEELYLTAKAVMNGLRNADKLMNELKDNEYMNKFESLIK